MALVIVHDKSADVKSWPRATVAQSDGVLAQRNHRYRESHRYSSCQFQVQHTLASSPGVREKF